MSGEGHSEGGEGVGPCVGCGETNHTAHHVSICAVCSDAARRHYRSQTCVAAFCHQRAAYCGKCSEERATQRCEEGDCRKAAKVCDEHVHAAASKAGQQTTCRKFACSQPATMCQACSNAQAWRICSWEGCSEPADLCRTHVEERLAAEREQRRILGDVANTVRVSFSPFEAAMVLCVLAVAKAGDSRYDTAAEPLRRRAIEAAYSRLSREMGLGELGFEAEPSA